jgi:uncharacterized protein (TIGR02145 family)
MKSIAIILFSFLCFGKINAQSVGIGTTTPQPSAKLEIASTTQGFLPPRMTLAQRNAIATPAEGLIVFCYECDELQIYTAGKWNNMVRDTACTISGQGVPICNQVWMKKNLDVTTYRNGDVIPQVTDNTAWNALTTGAWCWYNNDSATYSVYGKLYNWYAATDPRGLAPLGWHIPTDAEWVTLSTCLGGVSVAGGKMKEAGIAHWTSPNLADNISSFTSLGSGNRDGNGTFNNFNNNTFIWSTTASSATNAYTRYLLNNSIILFRPNSNKLSGFSVRCLRD